ncbi:MAG: ion channel [Sphingomicrobium sp.]
MLVSIAAAAFLVTMCFFVHLWTMERLRHLLYRRDTDFRHPMLIVIFSLFAAHLLEVLLYALGLSLLDSAGRGSLVGAVIGGPGWFEDHFYFSIAAYTTLGLGDIVPSGDIRIVAGLESLNGLVLVSWSASFTYLVMERLWGKKDPRESD